MKNNSIFAAIWYNFWNNIIKSSLLYRFLCGVYAFFSNQWKNGILTNLFRRNFFNAECIRSSFFGKLLFFPFQLIESIQQKSQARLNDLKEQSFLIRTFKYYLHNILALNTRFIGVLLFSASLLSILVTVGMGRFPYLRLTLSVLGVLLSFVNFNITDIIKHSFLVKTFEKAFGFEFSYDFYYLTKCRGKKRLLCSLVFGAVAGIIWAKFSLLFALVFLLGIWFVFMVFYKVEFGVYVTIFLTPLIPTMAVVGLSLLCLCSLLVKSLTTRKFTFKLDGVGFLILALLIVYLVSSVFSFARAKSLQIWAVYFAFMTFYFVVVNTVKTKKQLTDILTVFCISGFVVCLYGILQYLFGWNISQAWIDEEMFGDIKMRIYSTLENPNVLGEYILLALPLCIGLMWKKKNIFTKAAFLLMALIMGIALILTFSRGCWIGIMVAAGIFITFAAGKLWGLALPLIPIIPMVLPENILNRFSSIGDMKDSSTSYRVYIWMGTLLMLKDFWLSGIGPGTEAFSAVYPAYSYDTIVAPHSHSLFLQIMVESGIVGLVIFLILTVLFLKKLACAHQTFGKGHELSTLLVSVGAAVIGFMVQGLFDNCFYNYRVFMIFWTVIGLGSAAANIAKPKISDTEVKQNA